MYYTFCEVQAAGGFMLLPFNGLWQQHAKRQQEYYYIQ